MSDTPKCGRRAFACECGEDAGHEEQGTPHRCSSESCRGEWTYGELGEFAPVVFPGLDREFSEAVMEIFR